MAYIFVEPRLLKFGEGELNRRDLKKFCQHLLDVIELFSLTGDKMLMGEEIYGSIVSSTPTIPFSHSIKTLLNDDALYYLVQRMSSSLANGMIKNARLNNDCVISEEYMSPPFDDDYYDYLSSMLIGCSHENSVPLDPENYMIKSLDGLFKNDSKMQISCMGDKCNTNLEYCCYDVDQLKHIHRKLFMERDLSKIINGNRPNKDIESKSDGDHHSFAKKIRKFSDFPKAERDLFKELNMFARIEKIHVRENVPSLKYPGPCLYGFPDEFDSLTEIVTIKCKLALESNPNGIVGVFVELTMSNRAIGLIINYLKMCDIDYINFESLEIIESLL